MDEEARFRIKGFVARKFVSGSGKLGILTVETSIDGRRTKHEVKFFGDMVRLLENVGVGEEVDIAGNLNNTKLTNKDGTDVKKDNYSVWTTQLVAVRFQASAPKQETLDREPGSDDGDSLPEWDGVPT